jgi:hypothetical protein
MSLSGTLSTMPLPDLLQWLATAGKTGTLQVEREKVTKCIQLGRGRIVGCSSDDPPQRLGQYLLSRERISADQLRAALRRQEETGLHLGRILVDMEILSHDDLSAHLEGKAEETIYSLFDWNDAVFRFEDGLAPRNDVFPVDLQVQDVLLRGLKRYDEMGRIRQVLHDPGIVLRYTNQPPPREIFDNRMARTMYATIDGERTLRDVVLQVHGSEYIVYKFLYELHRNGYVEIAGIKKQEEAPERPAIARTPPAPVRPSAPARPAEPARPVATLERPARAAAQPTRPAAPADAIESRLAHARKLMNEAQYEHALDILDELYRQQPNDDALRRLTAEAEAAFVDRAYRHFVPPDKIPVLTRSVESLASESLSPHEFFLLSRIDGTWDVKSIIQIAPLREVEALRTLKRMREIGTIDLRDPE